MNRFVNSCPSDPNRHPDKMYPLDAVSPDDEYLVDCIHNVSTSRLNLCLSIESQMRLSLSSSLDRRSTASRVPCKGIDCVNCHT
jgi:hypothetical protein